jgi:hypothetical protein
MDADVLCYNLLNSAEYSIESVINYFLGYTSTCNSYNTNMSTKVLKAKLDALLH